MAGPAQAESAGSRSTVPAAVPVRADGEEPESDVVVVSPLLKAAAAMSGGVPSVIQVAATPALSRAASLPPPVTGPMFDFYVQAVSEAAKATATGRDGLVRLNQSVAPLAPVVNPAARPFAATGVEVLAGAMETGGEVAVLGGHHDSFPDWMAGVVRSSGRAMGF